VVIRMIIRMISRMISRMVRMIIRMFTHWVTGGEFEEPVLTFMSNQSVG
jgi:hypothetical protein